MSIKARPFLVYLIMIATDLISVQQGKDWLQVDFDDDAIIERLIKGSIAWIERYTSYYLFDRELTIYATSCVTNSPAYPINEITVKDKTGTLLDPQPMPTYGALRVYIPCPATSQITLKVGYSNVDDIPPPLLEGAYKLITYLYENRDAYGVTLPLDVQLLVNQYRRSATL